MRVSREHRVRRRNAADSRILLRHFHCYLRCARARLVRAAYCDLAQNRRGTGTAANRYQVRSSIRRCWVGGQVNGTHSWVLPCVHAGTGWRQQVARTPCLCRTRTRLYPGTEQHYNRSIIQGRGHSFCMEQTSRSFKILKTNRSPTGGTRYEVERIGAEPLVRAAADRGTRTHSGALTPWNRRRAGWDGRAGDFAG